MPESTSTDNRMLIRRTLVTVAVMVSACVVVVGTLTLVASTIAGHAVEPQLASDGGAAVPNKAAPSPSKVQPGNTLPPNLPRR